MVKSILSTIAFTLLSLLVTGASAQTTTYNTSKPYACNQEVCNGIPLDQGGTWQFILANSTFSLNSNGFYIFGNPGSYTGGIYNVVDQIPLPPRRNGSVGAEGTLTFDWTAVLGSDESIHYSGSATVVGHQVCHCNQHGCWFQRVVDSASIPVSLN